MLQYFRRHIRFGELLLNGVLVPCMRGDMGAIPPITRQDMQRLSLGLYATFMLRITMAIIVSLLHEMFQFRKDVNRKREDVYRIRYKI